MVNWLVPSIDLQNNGSAVLTIQVDDIDITYGNWVEISGYIIQEDIIQGNVIQKPGVFVPFSAIQMVPRPVNGTSSVTVNVAAAWLTSGIDVKVLTRVTPVEIWPTLLQADSNRPRAVQGVMAAWRARAGNPDSGSWPQQTPRQSSTVSTIPPATVEVSSPDPSISLKDLRPGRQYRITVEELGHE
jgi:hypothetical protein